MAAKDTSPTPMAIRYGGTGLVMRKRVAVRPEPAASGAPTASALITTLRSDGAVMRASQVWRTPGLSWVGTQVRVRIAWPWLNI